MGTRIIICKKKLWKLIENIWEKDSKPWLISGDSNELSTPDEKLSVSKGNSTWHNDNQGDSKELSTPDLIILLIMITLLI